MIGRCGTRRGVWDDRWVWEEEEGVGCGRRRGVWEEEEGVG